MSGMITKEDITEAFWSQNTRGIIVLDGVDCADDITREEHWQSLAANSSGLDVTPDVLIEAAKAIVVDEDKDDEIVVAYTIMGILVGLEVAKERTND